MVNFRAKKFSTLIWLCIHAKSFFLSCFSILLVSDFTEDLAQIYAHQAESLQAVVATYRKRNVELRKERYLRICMMSVGLIKIDSFERETQFFIFFLCRPACQSSLFNTWEIFLQEIEADSQSSSDVANILSRQVSAALTHLLISAQLHLNNERFCNFASLILSTRFRDHY